MNPQFFGTAERSLYGVYHPPRARVAKRTGVVCCYPFGQEYMRSHRAFRQLASLLTRAGFHLFRFDYTATGDSAGDAREVSLAHWREDIGHAIEELKAMAEVERVALVGLRLGGTIAAEVAATRDDIAQVVLWDPVVRGAEYVAELLAASDDVQAGRPSGPEHTVGVMGFPMTPAFRAELLQIDAPAAPPPVSARTLMVVSGERPEFAALAQALTARGTRVVTQVVPSPGNWGEVDDNGSALIPVALIQAIVQDLTMECA
ncbi:MAG: alpha/beta hydrolase [Gemmatimonadaceae bacterium]|nr:alpha/beta hydrolase [Gemmatimonadaceae bacterium]